MGDAEQVALIEQRELNRAALEQPRDGRRAQGADPVNTFEWLEVLAQACLGQHAAIADDDKALEREALAQLAQLRGDGVGIRGVALEDLDRDRATLGVAQQPEHDL